MFHYIDTMYDCLISHVGYFFSDWSKSFKTKVRTLSRDSDELDKTNRSMK